LESDPENRGSNNLTTNPRFGNISVWESTKPWW